MHAPAAVAAPGALAHEHRLAVFRLLVEAGHDGLPAGEIAAQLGLAPSSLTFHTRALQAAALVSQRRVSRRIFYAADFASMNALLAYLTKNCCGEAGNCGPTCVPATSLNTKKRRRA